MVNGRIKLQGLLNQMNLQNTTEIAGKLAHYELDDYLDGMQNLVAEEPRLTETVFRVLKEINRDDLHERRRVFSLLLARVYREISLGWDRQDVAWVKTWQRHGIVPIVDRETAMDTRDRYYRIRKNWTGNVKLLCQLYIQQGDELGIQIFSSLRPYYEKIQQIQSLAQEKFVETNSENVRCIGQSQTNRECVHFQNYKRVITHTVEGLLYMAREAGFRLQRDEPELCDEICTLADTWKYEKVPGTDESLLDGWLRTNIDIMLVKKVEGFQDVRAAGSADRLDPRNSQHDRHFAQYILPLSGSNNGNI